MHENPINNIPILEVKEVGFVKEVKRGIAKVDGLPSCIYGQLVEFGNSIKGMVAGFNSDETSIIIFGDERNIRMGDRVVTFSELFNVGVGDNFLGRIVGSSGQAIDGKSALAPSEFYPVFRQAPGVMARQPIDEPFLTGIKTLDLTVPIGKGQRELIVGDRQTGKSSIAIDTIINQKDKDVICIYCWIGGSFSTFEGIIHELKRKGAFSYLIGVCASASTSSAEQYLCPYTATAIGEYFMHRGRDVFIVFDDLVRHAWAYRQMSLLLERAPGREAYPGDIFFLHSQLMERAGRLHNDRGGGSMTFFPIAETFQGDITGYIQSNLVSMTDGQIYLSTSLFNEGFKPAVDLGLSVSRIGSKVQYPAIKSLSSGLRLEYAQYRDLLRLTRLRTHLSDQAMHRMKRGAVLNELLIQTNFEPLSLAEEIILFYFFQKGILEKLEPILVKRFKREIFGFFRDFDDRLLEDLQAKGDLTEDIRQRLDVGVEKYLERSRKSK